MKRLNNKGFAISTILFSILILGTLVFGTLYATTISNNTCQNGCCEPPCEIPEKEEVNTCTYFKDFSCPNEFVIGDKDTGEHFCVLRTYSNSDTSINDEVVVALAKYYVNADESKNNIAPYGLQYKYAVCENMTAKSITSSKINIEKGYYSILNSNAKVNTKVTKPATFTARPIWSDGSTGSNQTYNFDLVSLGSRTTLTSNPINDLALLYYSNLKTKNNSLNSLVVRLLNLRDLNDTTNRFPCYDIRNGVKAYVKDDIDGDHGVGGFGCDYKDNYHWIYSPTANTDFYGLYLTNIIQISNTGDAYSHAIGSTTSHFINKSFYSYATGDDFYNNYYFRPVIELSKTEYNSLSKV